MSETQDLIRTDAVTKSMFTDAVSQRLRETRPWALELSTLQAFMANFAETMSGTGRHLVTIDSPVIRQVWKDLGFKGKPTYKALQVSPPDNRHRR
jgi:hypothetical protein